MRGTDNREKTDVKKKRERKGKEEKEAVSSRKEKT